MTLPSPLAGEGDSRSRERGEGSATTPRTSHLAHARTMRATPTDAERALWRLLRDRRMLAWKFRRQVVVGPYIADFMCYEARLIVEADGGQHGDNALDGVRTAWLEGQGFRVLRFWNNAILTNGDGVARSILAALEDPLTPLGCAESPSPARGEGKEG